jgi:hypothetical protein
MRQGLFVSRVGNQRYENSARKIVEPTSLEHAWCVEWPLKVPYVIGTDPAIVSSVAGTIAAGVTRE